MNKNDIKTKWGHYADTDKLVDDVMSLLTKYNHRNSEYGVCCMLDRFFTSKEELIKLVQKSDHYIGNLRIVIDEDIERRADHREIQVWLNNFLRVINASNYILKRTDEKNKTIDDYLRVGRCKVSVNDFENAEFRTTLSYRAAALAKFNHNGFTRESEKMYDRFMRAMDIFDDCTSTTISEDNAQRMEIYKIHKGTKTSRAFNKICSYHGIDKAPEYNKEFAKYADMISECKRHIKFFISVNPLDYLTMSFGVNWASCHTIDKQNLRGTPNHYSGGYCAGTMSYMLDSTSIVTYVHDTMPENYETGKVYRNMFHLSPEGVLLQGRVYPQGNDGCTDLYQEFRYIMQKELTQMLGLESNKWTKKSSVRNVSSIGAHYKDYNNFSDCNISYPSERPQCSDEIISVGSYRICPYCGESADDIDRGRLSHSCCEIEEIWEE